MLKSDPLHELKERANIHGIPPFGKAFYGSNGCEEHNMHQKTENVFRNFHALLACGVRATQWPRKQKHI